MGGSVGRVRTPIENFITFFYFSSFFETFPNSFNISESTALEWLSKTGLVKYSLPPNTNINTQSDKLSFGIITPRADAVILRVDSLSSNDYLELEIVSILQSSPLSAPVSNNQW